MNRKPLAFGSKLWMGLATYIFVVDLFALLSGKETLTDALRRSCKHPIKRWPVMVMWLLTTKHLFFGQKLPWLDPYNGIALTALGIQKIVGKKDETWLTLQLSPLIPES